MPDWTNLTFTSRQSPDIAEFCKFIWIASHSNTEHFNILKYPIWCLMYVARRGQTSHGQDLVYLQVHTYQLTKILGQKKRTFRPHVPYNMHVSTVPQGLLNQRRYNCTSHPRKAAVTDILVYHNILQHRISGSEFQSSPLYCCDSLRTEPRSFPKTSFWVLAQRKSSLQPADLSFCHDRHPFVSTSYITHPHSQ